MNELLNYFPQKANAKRRKGRSEEHIARRDEKLATRFYFYAHLKGLNYETTISSLVEEFDVCEKTIIERLKANQEILDELFAEKPNTTKLRRKIPHFVW